MKRLVDGGEEGRSSSGRSSERSVESTYKKLGDNVAPRKEVKARCDDFLSEDDYYPHSEWYSELSLFRFSIFRLPEVLRESSLQLASPDITWIGRKLVARLYLKNERGESQYYYCKLLDTSVGWNEAMIIGTMLNGYGEIAKNPTAALGKVYSPTASQLTYLFRFIPSLMAIAITTPNFPISSSRWTMVCLFQNCSVASWIGPSWITMMLSFLFSEDLLQPTQELPPANFTFIMEIATKRTMSLT
jgi:hypothetical protein